MRVNPGPAVGKQQTLPWTTAPKTTSLGLLVETDTDVFPLSPVAEAGKEPLGSKGLWKLAPFIPKTIKLL